MVPSSARSTASRSGASHLRPTTQFAPTAVWPRSHLCLDALRHRCHTRHGASVPSMDFRLRATCDPRQPRKHQDNLANVTSPRKQMNELESAVAQQIKHWHSKAEGFANDAKTSAADAMSSAVNAGNFIAQAEQLSRGKMLAWLRDNVPDITIERAKAYLSIFRTSEARFEMVIDHRQLLLLGVIDQKISNPSEVAPTKIDSPKWMGWKGNICAWFNKETAQRPVERWTPEERHEVANQLKPLVEIYERLNGTF